MKSTNKDMMDSLWGVAKRYKYGVAVAATDWNGISEKKKNAIEKMTSKIARKIKNNSGNVKPGLKTKVFFWIMHLMQRNGFTPPVMLNIGIQKDGPVKRDYGNEILIFES